MWSSPHNALRKIMRTVSVTIVAIAVLVSACLFSACVSPTSPANQTPQVPTVTELPKIDVGISQVVQEPMQEPISFAEAKRSFLQNEGNFLTSIQKHSQVLFIQAGNLDKTGNAGQWIFGVNRGDSYELRVYDRSGWAVIPWTATLSGQEIDLDHVVSPAVLFNQTGMQTLIGTQSTIPVQRDIELKNGTYRLTVTSGNTSQILMFNATTGDVIE
jgi:hypothetical protein